MQLSAEVTFVVDVAPQPELQPRSPGYGMAADTAAAGTTAAADTVASGTAAVARYTAAAGVAVGTPAGTPEVVESVTGARSGCGCQLSCGDPIGNSLLVGKFLPVQVQARFVPKSTRIFTRLISIHQHLVIHSIV